MAEGNWGRSLLVDESSMAADRALIKKFDSDVLLDSAQSRCNRCKSKKKVASVICHDCGGLLLCNECNKRMHQSLPAHHLEELTTSPFNGRVTNGSEHNCAARNNKSETDVARLDVKQNVPKSLLLIDGQEKLQIKNGLELIDELGCPSAARAKVISIFGNTGDGKSHTLNHTFFNGADVFDTSPSQKSCTVGVWAAYDNCQKALILDTEGLLGVSENSNKRMRLLLKILAISDVVIYRTRAERLHSDMFTFLGDASEAYLKHFTRGLAAVKERGKIDLPVCNLGPAIIIFQECHYTTPLGTGQCSDVSPEDVLRESFSSVGRNPHAFSSISYVGTQTQTPPTDFSGLLKEVQVHLKNSSVRSSRPLSVIFDALVHLNTKFGDDIDDVIPNSFPDAYFTCSAKCQSCGTGCNLSMNHDADHGATARCKYQAQFDNKVYLCKICYEKGNESIVCPKTSEARDAPLVGLAKYAWSGYVLECPECGVIYRSRQYWYGNKDPVEACVRTEIKHCWPGSRLPHSQQNAARRLLDGVNSLAYTLTNVSAKPAKAVSNWVTDKIAPSYWIPNYQILECTTCGHDFDEFEKKHHCRACGQGFCDGCTQHRIPVADRGWGDTPVRVCNNCFKSSGLVDQAGTISDDIDLSELLEAIDDDPAIETGAMVAIKSTENIPVRHPPDVVTSRKLTESVQSTISYLSSTLEYPIECLVDSARPVYWVPDSQILDCRECRRVFKPSESKHHCRACGQGVCDGCSQQRLAVPSRGWDYPVRVCGLCAQKKGPL